MNRTEIARLRLIPFACIASAAAPTLAQNAAPSGKLPMTASADLLGDGKREAVSVEATNKNEDVVRFTLTVGAGKLTVPIAPSSGMEFCRGLQIVQVDNGLRARQVVVALGAPDDLVRSYLFGYDGNRIYPLGFVDRWKSAPGNGAVYAEPWMGFWSATEKYVVDLKRHSLTQVPQPLYYVGKTATVTKSFPLYRDRSAVSGTVADVAPGSQILLVGYRSGKETQLDDGQAGWYLIKSQTGLCGWAQLKTFQEKQTGLPFAG